MKRRGFFGIVFGALCAPIMSKSVIARSPRQLSGRAILGLQRLSRIGDTIRVRLPQRYRVSSDDSPRPTTRG